MFFVVVRVSVGVIRVVMVGGGGSGALLGAELGCCVVEGLLEGGGLEREVGWRGRWRRGE
jgi:hypothetical protein